MNTARNIESRTGAARQSVRDAEITEAVTGAKKIDSINLGIRNRQNPVFLWRKTMTVQELMEQMSYFPKNAIVMYKNNPVDAVYYTRDFLPDDPEERKNIVVMI